MTKKHIAIAMTAAGFVGIAIVSWMPGEQLIAAFVSGFLLMQGFLWLVVER